MKTTNDNVELNSLQVDLTRQTLEFLIEQQCHLDFHVSELLLIDKLQVSRTPVRVVLKYLAYRGAVRNVPNRGYFLCVNTNELENIKNTLPANEEDELYVKIVQDCGNHKLKDVVNEVELVKRYNVKRNALLKVLQKLANDGIFRRESGHGWRVIAKPASKQMKMDSYNFRRALEPAAMLLNTFRADEKKIHVLEREHHNLITLLNDKQNSKESLHTETMIKVFEINCHFHETIASFSNNQYFLEAVRNQNRLRRVLEYRYMETHEPGRIIESCEEHLAILNAVKKADLEWASTLMHRHITIAQSLPSSFESH